MTRRRSSAFAATAAFIAVSFGTHVHAQSDGAVVDLLARGLDAWIIEGDADVSMIDEVLRIEEPQGWLKSEEQYANVELAIEFRFLTDDADSGIFLRTLGEATFARGWPNASYQVQLRNPIGQSPFPPVGGVFRHGMPPGPTTFDDGVAATASRPTGEWQTLEISLVGESLTVMLNGVELTRASGIERSTGHIGIQAETGAVEFRSIALRELP